MSLHYFVVQGKIQKHQTFEAELAAHNNVIHTLKSTGKRMIDHQHFAATQIRVSLSTLINVTIIDG